LILHESDKPDAQARGNTMDTCLVAYDISDPKRLRKVAQTCEDFGFRRQYAVFLCRLAAVDLVRLKSRLYDLINLQEDQVLFMPLCGRSAEQIEALGRPVERHDAKDVVIVI
jgi:CRISPR-associated protein Cas2